MALNQHLTGTDLFINPLRNLTNFFRHFFFKPWLSLELPRGINLPLVTSTKVTVLLIFNKWFVVSFLYRRTKNLIKRYKAPSMKLRSSVGNGGVRFPVKESIGSHQQIYEVHFFTFGKVVLSYWTNNKALCHIYHLEAVMYDLLWVDHWRTTRSSMNFQFPTTEPRKELRNHPISV